MITEGYTMAPKSKAMAIGKTNEFNESCYEGNKTSRSPRETFMKISGGHRMSPTIHTKATQRREFQSAGHMKDMRRSRETM